MGSPILWDSPYIAHNSGTIFGEGWREGGWSWTYLNDIPIVIITDNKMILPFFHLNTKSVYNFFFIKNNSMIVDCKVRRRLRPFFLLVNAFCIRKLPIINFCSLSLNCYCLIDFFRFVLLCGLDLENKL